MTHNKSMIFVAAPLLALCASITHSAQPSVQSAPQPAARATSQPIGCIIEPDEVVEVGTPVIGVIQSIVKRGDTVKKTR